MSKFQWKKIICYTKNQENLKLKEGEKVSQ
jgi:hypothetical protein